MPLLKSNFKKSFTGKLILTLVPQICRLTAVYLKLFLMYERKPHVAS